MHENVLVGLAAVIVVGISAQWVAWRVRLPSILLLLFAGFMVGPVLGLLDPDALFGELLLPLVSLSVAIILFEGGLSLKFSELPKVGRAVLNLVSVGALTTWVIGSAAAYVLLGFELDLALLFGAIIIVTGPTVTGPLLRHVRPIAKLNSVLKWEGIAIDPLGVMFAVVVFEVLLAGELAGAPTLAATFIVKTVLIGGGIGVGMAAILVFLLRRFWVPDYLQSPVSLMLVVCAFAISDILQAESGLLTVTVMGMVLANQTSVPVKHIVQFKENLRVLLISGLFILLAARLKISDLEFFGLGTVIFILVLLFVARPAAAFLSTYRLGFSKNERLFISWLAPRGIVAAAMASVFALALAEAGHPQAEKLVPYTFFVIVSTVSVYGLSASAVARKLKVAQADPQGVVMLGAHSWARMIGEALQAEGFRVILVDTNRDNIRAARMIGLDNFYGNVLDEQTVHHLELDGVGRFLALTGNDEVNSLAVMQFTELFGRSEVYQLKTRHRAGGEDGAVSRHLLGRLLFKERATYSYLTLKFAEGATVKTTQLTPEFGYSDFLDEHGSSAIPIFLINSHHELTVYNLDSHLSPESGHTLISIVERPVAELSDVERPEAATAVEPSESAT